MIEKTFTITSEEGLHARPCALLVSAVTPFASDIKLSFNGKQVNLKSIMGVMSLGVTANSEVTVLADGVDEAEAMAKVEEVIVSEGLGQ